ncbi:hypothetical protein K8I31_04525, partial [bacterium]|nr:hypothetical protein [bacterium]
LTIEGADENPILIWGGGETIIRSSSGVNNWSHLWCIGMQDGDGDGAINTNFAARIDPNGGASLTASNCIFAYANNDGIFMNFDATEPLTYEINQCTFYNVPALIRFGFVGEPGPSDNVMMTITDTIVDNGDWVANNDGTYFPPETTVVDYGDGDNTLAQVSITNLGHRSETLISSRSGSSAPIMDGNIIEVGDFEFKTTEFDPQTMSDFLVVANCELLGSVASGGNPLGGARPADCPINAIDQWSIH